MNFAIFLGTPFSQNNSGQMLLRLVRILIQTKQKKNIHRNRNITVQKYNKYGWDTQTSAIRKTNQEHPTKLDRDGPKK